MFTRNQKVCRQYRAGFAVVATSAALTSVFAQPNLEVRIENAVQSNFAAFIYQATDVGATTPQIVVLRNIGPSDLLFPSASPISVDGGFAEQFELVQPPLESGNKLSPNGSTAFLVRFAPTIPKAQMSAFVRIASNDPDTSLFSINVTGIVPVADMVVTADGQSVTEGNQLNLPQTVVGQVSSRTVTIQNAGQRPLTLTSPIDVSGGFGSNAFSVVEPATDTVPPGESVTFEARFAPQQAGSASATIGITSNDIGNFPNGRLTFVVRGVASPAPDDDDANSGGTPDDVNTDQEEIDADDDNGTPIDDAGANTDATDDENAEAVEDAEIDSIEDEIVKSAFGGFCGGGLGFAPLASLAGLVAIKRRRRT